jgi:hypothetical protein
MLCRLTRGGSDYKVCYVDKQGEEVGYKVCYVDLPGRGWAIKYAMSTNMGRKCAI